MKSNRKRTVFALSVLALTVLIAVPLVASSSGRNQAAAGQDPVFKCVGFDTHPFGQGHSQVYLHNDDSSPVQVRVRWYYDNGQSLLGPVATLQAEQTARSEPPDQDFPAILMAAKVSASSKNVLVDGRAVHESPDHMERQVLCTESASAPDPLSPRTRG